MVGYLHIPATEEEAVAEQTEDLKIQSLSDIKKLPSPNDPLGLSLLELEDFSSSFSDSFLDFDTIDCWFTEENPEHCSDRKMADLGENPVGFGSDKGEFGASLESVKMVGDEICEKNEVANELSGGVGSLRGLGQEKGEIGVVNRSVEMSSELVSKEIIDKGVLSGDEFCEKLGDFECLIEEQLGKVSLDGVSNASMLVIPSENTEMSGVNDGDVDSGNGLKIGETIKRGICDVMGGNESGMKSRETVDDEDENDSDLESEDESSSSSSSSSSSDGEDEHEKEEEDNRAMVDGNKANNKKDVVKGEMDVEEGEILLSDADETVAWIEDEEDDGGGSATAGPVTSKNELKVLPPIPSVTVTLQPHHQTLPVGIILSIIGAQIIVEGVEKHNPLNEGSILWITESRSPLGIVDDVFGPVKNPYYIVRYNLESEVPAKIQQGTLISFVSEFANHVLNDKSLYQKGYDASGENDEELLDELEFSDDEKEAEYKRMLKMKKRGTYESKPGIKRKEKGQFKKQTSNWKSNLVPSAKTPSLSDKLPVTEDQHLVPPVPTSFNQENYSCSSGLGQGFSSNQAIISPFPVRTSAPGFCAPNGIWGNGFQHPQPQSIGLSSGVAANNMLWMQQNQPYQSHQTPLQTGVAFQQLNTTIPGWPFNLNSLVEQSIFGGGPAFVPWPGFLDQNVFNQSQFGTGLQGQHASVPQNVSEQVLQPNGSQITNSSQLSPANSGNPQNLKRGRGGGRRGHHRGGRHYGGGRGRSHGRQQL